MSNTAGRHWWSGQINSRKKKVFGMALVKIRHLTAQRESRMFVVKHHSVMSLKVKVAPETKLKFLN